MPDVPVGSELTIPVPSGAQLQEAFTDPTIKHVLDQAFAANHQQGLHAATRHSAGNDAVAELTRNLFLKETQQVGVREAAASQRLDTDKLATAVLAQRSASVQPAVAGSAFEPAAGVKSA